MRLVLQPSRIAGILVFASLVLPVTLAAVEAQARVETLRWQHPDPGAVAFFRIYVRDPSGEYGPPVYQGLPPSEGNTFSQPLAVADSQSIYVSVSAVGHDILESERSNEQLRAPDSEPEPDTGVGSGIGRWDSAEVGSGGNGGEGVPAVAPEPGGFLAELAGVEKLRIRGTGRQSDAVQLELALGDGRWMALDAEGRVIAGTYRSKGRTGRRAVLRLDADSAQVIAALIDAWAPQLGASAFRAELRRKPKIELRVNRDRTRVRLEGKLRLGGAKYSFELRGPIVGAE